MLRGTALSLYQPEEDILFSRYETGDGWKHMQGQNDKKKTGKDERALTDWGDISQGFIR